MEEEVLVGGGGHRWIGKSGELGGWEALIGTAGRLGSHHKFLAEACGDEA